MPSIAVADGGPRTTPARQRYEGAVRPRRTPGGGAHRISRRAAEDACKAALRRSRPPEADSGRWSPPHLQAGRGRRLQGSATKEPSARGGLQAVEPTASPGGPRTAPARQRYEGAVRPRQTPGGGAHRISRRAADGTCKAALRRSRPPEADSGRWSPPNLQAGCGRRLHGSATREAGDVAPSNERSRRCCRRSSRHRWRSSIGTPRTRLSGLTSCRS